MGSRLHVAGVPDWGPWDSGRLDWWREDQLDLILAKGEYGEKVHTLEELECGPESADEDRADAERVDPRITRGGRPSPV